MKSSAILPRVLVSIASVEVYSRKASRELVASIEFFIMLSKPSSIAVLFLSIGMDEPPIAHAPSGDWFIL